jgi:chitinase
MKKPMTVAKQVLAMALCLGVASQADAAFKVVGYFPTWQGDVNRIPYTKVTHINYSFLIPRADGSLNAIEGGGARLNTLVQKAHAANAKVLIAVGGWNNGDDSAFRSLASNAGYRSNFINNIVNFVNQYNLDGVDIDWEYPEAGAEADNFRRLMSELSQRLRPSGKLLTAAVTANDGPGSVDSTIINAVDYLNLMVYDMGYPHSTYSHAQNALTHWIYNEGLPKQKAILGVPFYSEVRPVKVLDLATSLITD